MLRKGILGLAVGTALAVFASTAQAVTFQANYDLDVNSGSGLMLETMDLTPGAGQDFNINLVNIGDTAITTLADIWTDEEFVGWDDLVPRPVQLDINITAPAVFGGNVGGWSGGLSLFGIYENGYLNWNNNGNFSATSSNGWVLNMHVDNLGFNDGWGGLNPGYDGRSTLTLQTTLAAAAVPEPATWAMMITGFGLAGAALRRRRSVLGVQAEAA